MKVVRFEDLQIWQQSRELVVKIYAIFDGESKATHDFGFKSQITRAAISVMHNIAEGFERNGDAEFAQFLSIAKASSGEVRSMLYAAEDLFYLSPENSKSIRTEYEELSRGIAKLANYLRE